MVDSFGLKTEKQWSDNEFVHQSLSASGSSAGVSTA